MRTCHESRTSSSKREPNLAWRPWRRRSESVAHLSLGARRRYRRGMRLCAVLVCFALVACGGNDDVNDSEGSCLLRAEVSGAVSIRFTGKDDAACLTQHSFDTGLDATFSGLGGKGMLELSIAEVAEAEIGDDYMAEVGVMSADKERWRGTGCLASLTAHDLVEAEASELGELRHYQVAGSGRCVGPLESVPAGAEPVTVEAFDFRAQFTWRD